MLEAYKCSKVVRKNNSSFRKIGCRRAEKPFTDFDDEAKDVCAVHVSIKTNET